jgi:hypothetical protein
MPAAMRVTRSSEQFTSLGSPMVGFPNWLSVVKPPVQDSEKVSPGTVEKVTPPMRIWEILEPTCG